MIDFLRYALIFMLFGTIFYLIKYIHSLEKDELDELINKAELRYIAENEECKKEYIGEVYRIDISHDPNFRFYKITKEDIKETVSVYDEPPQYYKINNRWFPRDKVLIYKEVIDEFYDIKRKKIMKKGRK